MSNDKAPRMTKHQIENINGRLVDKRGKGSAVYRKPLLTKGSIHPNENDFEDPDAPANPPLVMTRPEPRRCYHDWQDRLPADSPFRPDPTPLDFSSIFPEPQTSPAEKDPDNDEL